jgi:diguanylate cyclase (GGDEF)-like protein
MGNAVTFQQAVREEVARSKRSLSQFTLLLIDVGNVEEIQKLLGTDGPEDMATKIAKAITTNTRDIDKKGKLDLTLFGLTLPNCDKSQYPIVVERIEKVLKGLEVEYRGRTLRMAIKLAIGSATYPKDGETFEKLIETARHSLVEDQKIKNRLSGLDSSAQRMQEDTYNPKQV